MILMSPSAKHPLRILLAQPRGFCAGVVRAIDIVERALVKHGAPVYVRHEIVHNKFVVQSLTDKGAIFIAELDEIPLHHRKTKPVIFSAHGVPKSVPQDAASKAMYWIDATCPLVSKVHREIERFYDEGSQILMIGHHGHPEVIGTMGQLPQGVVRLIETRNDVETLDIAIDTPLAFVTQTTLSVDDTQEIVTALKAKYPHIRSSKAEDICYATTNRQEAVKAIAPSCEAFIIIGAPNSSNSNRLVDVARKAGVKHAFLLQRANQLDWNLLEGITTLGLSSGASAPDILVQELIEKIRQYYDVTLDLHIARKERVKFSLPKALRDVPPIQSGLA